MNFRLQIILQKPVI